MMDLNVRNEANEAGVVSGGWVRGVGVAINWQRGPTRNADGNPIPPNGATIEAILNACAQRLDAFQQTSMACQENADAFVAIHQAIAALEARTARRTAEGVEGTWDR